MFSIHQHLTITPTTLYRIGGINDIYNNDVFMDVD